MFSHLYFNFPIFYILVNLYFSVISSYLFQLHINFYICGHNVFIFCVSELYFLSLDLKESTSKTESLFYSYILFVSELNVSFHYCIVLLSEEVTMACLLLGSDNSHHHNTSDVVSPCPLTGKCAEPIFVGASLWSKPRARNPAGASSELVRNLRQNMAM